MNRSEFEAIIPFKIQDIVSLIVDNKKLSFHNAVQYLYDSKLYDALSVEETKLWHLSSNKLLEMLVEEKQTGKFTYPDFV